MQEREDDPLQWYRSSPNSVHARDGFLPPGFLPPGFLPPGFLPPGFLPPSPGAIFIVSRHFEAICMNPYDPEQDNTTLLHLISSEVFARLRLDNRYVSPVFRRMQD